MEEKHYWMINGILYGLAIGLATTYIVYLWGSHQKKMKEMYWQMLEEYKRDITFYKLLSEMYKQIKKP